MGLGRGLFAPVRPFSKTCQKVNRLNLGDCERSWTHASWREAKRVVVFAKGAVSWPASLTGRLFRVIWRVRIAKFMFSRRLSTVLCSVLIMIALGFVTVHAVGPAAGYFIRTALKKIASDKNVKTFFIGVVSSVTANQLTDDEISRLDQDLLWVLTASPNGAESIKRTHTFTRETYDDGAVRDINGTLISNEKKTAKYEKKAFDTESEVINNLNDPSYTPECEHVNLIGHGGWFYVREELNGGFHDSAKGMFWGGTTAMDWDKYTNLVYRELGYNIENPIEHLSAALTVTIGNYWQYERNEWEMNNLFSLRTERAIHSGGSLNKQPPELTDPGTYTVELSFDVRKVGWGLWNDDGSICNPEMVYGEVVYSYTEPHIMSSHITDTSLINISDKYVLSPGEAIVDPVILNGGATRRAVKETEYLCEFMNMGRAGLNTDGLLRCYVKDPLGLWDPGNHMAGVSGGFSGLIQGAEPCNGVLAYWGGKNEEKNIKRVVTFMYQEEEQFN